MSDKKKDECYKGDAEEIREQYEKLSKKYSLPLFKELNEDFDIVKAEFGCETLLRDIRKEISTKYLSALNIVELLLNPSNGSMFHMFLVKSISKEEKDILDNLFDKIGEIQIEGFELDVYYNEKKEAEFIKKTFHLWQEIKPDLAKVIKSLKDNWRKTSFKKEKSYFG
ncbi:MAG: hypothetical protein WC533_02490 [Candidatus Pacearchaeota archaeon]